jgi:hypothetical protein
MAPGPFLGQGPGPDQASGASSALVNSASRAWPMAHQGSLPRPEAERKAASRARMRARSSSCVKAS